MKVKDMTEKQKAYLRGYMDGAICVREELLCQIPKSRIALGKLMGTRRYLPLRMRKGFDIEGVE